jgi:hypothetical protein
MNYQFVTGGGIAGMLTSGLMHWTDFYRVAK